MTRKNAKLEVLKEVLLLVFWLTAFASVFMPDSLAYWLAEGFTK